MHGEYNIKYIIQGVSKICNKFGHYTGNSYHIQIPGKEMLSAIPKFNSSSVSHAVSVT
jgi:hypothetical protein